MKHRLAVAIQLGALLVGATRANAQKPLTAEDTLAIRTIGDLRLSPDGSRIAFTLAGGGLQSAKPSSSVMLMASTGGEPKPIAGVREGASSLRWSPDGARLAYFANDGEGQAIFVAGVDSGRETRVSKYDRGNSYLAHAGNMLAWSPDGKQIAFAGTLEPKPAAPDPMVVTRILYKTRTSYSDNRRTHLYVVSANGGQPRQLTTGEYDEHSIDWGAGREIVFLSNRGPNPDALLNYDLFAVNASSGGVRQLTRTPGVEMDPHVSPDGKWIAYTATKRRITTIDSVAEDAHVWVISSAGGDGRELSYALDRRASGPLWGADSKTIFFTAGDRGKTVIYRIAAQTGDATPVVDRQAQASNVNVAKDGSVLFVMSDPAAPGEIYRLAKSGEPQKLTSFHTELVKGWQLSKPELIWFPSFDGTRVEGFLYPPLNAAGSKQPMILAVHGGPHGAHNWGFNANFQVYAGRGYGVLAINPRGSSGYGQKFSDGSVNNWGGGDYKDLMAGVDAMLRANSWIDADRLGVTGGSYGGFMTNWIVTQTSRFKAAAALASVSNLVSFYATSLYQDLVHQEFNGFPWDNYELLWKWSPLAHIKNATTPLLLIHGEQDNDVHITQAEEMYTSLRQRGVEAMFVRYPREGHGFREARHRVDSLTRTVDWMDRFLKK